MGEDANFDRWARYYDGMYDSKELGDVEFYREEATRDDDPVLELACGTGRVYLELLEAGADADGLDASAEMLRILEEKADERGLAPNVWQDDMRTFDAPREYGTVLIPFRSILHLHSIEDQLSTLRRIREHLLPGGRLVFNVFTPDHDRIANPQTIEEDVEGPDGEDWRLVDHAKTVDPVAPLLHIDRELRDEDGDVVWESGFDLKPIYRREMELLVRLAGFSDWTGYGGFDRQPLGEEIEEQVWIVEQ